jgi:hypothetical protein
MIQYSLLGRSAALTRLNTTFWGLAPSPSSGKTDFPVLPEDEDGASPRNVVFKRVNVADRPRRLYWMIKGLNTHDVKQNWPYLFQVIRHHTVEIFLSNFNINGNGQGRVQNAWMLILYMTAAYCSSVTQTVATNLSNKCHISALSFKLKMATNIKGKKFQIVIIQCKIWDPHSSVDGSSLLGRYAMSAAKELHSSETSVILYRSQWCNIPKDLHFQSKSKVMKQKQRSQIFPIFRQQRTYYCTNFKISITGWQKK